MELKIKTSFNRNGSGCLCNVSHVFVQFVWDFYLFPSTAPGCLHLLPSVYFSQCFLYSWTGLVSLLAVLLMSLVFLCIMFLVFSVALYCFLGYLLLFSSNSSSGLESSSLLSLSLLSLQSRSSV